MSPAAAGRPKMDVPFVIRWREQIRFATMPVGRKGFAALLSTWADADGTSCFPSIKTLSTMGFAKRTVQTYLKALEKDGWLTIERGGGRRPDGSYAFNRYTLRVPAGAERAPLHLVVGGAEDAPLNGLGGAERALNDAPSGALTVQGEHHDVVHRRSQRPPAVLQPVKGKTGKVIGHRYDDDLSDATTGA
jgi:hypothetical protein